MKKCEKYIQVGHTAPAYNPNPHKAKAQGSGSLWVGGQSKLCGEFKASLHDRAGPCLKNKQKNK